MPAVILYGPPAAGKDAVTKSLTELDNNYRLYQRIKVGAGRTVGYRMTALPQVENLRSSGDIIWENYRYGALYVVDRPSLSEMLQVCIPVLHLGQVEAVEAIITTLPSTRWTVVWLWCPRNIAHSRIAGRDTGDITARMRVWDETRPLLEVDISINTAEVHPTDAAAKIHSQVQNRRLEDP